MGFFSELFKEANEDVKKASYRRSNVNTKNCFDNNKENGYNEYDNDRWDKYEDNDF